MRILLACDKFKGTLSADAVTRTFAGPLQTAGHDVVVLPIADGGDGTVTAAVSAGFTPHNARVTGSLGQPLEAQWCSRGDIALVELAEASGLSQVDPTPETSLRATSSGVGELIRTAIESGCTQVIVGLGGSACTDGGAGLLASLGAVLLTESGEAPVGGGQLGELTQVDPSPVREFLAAHGAQLVVASDVNNPLLGADGAAAIYGPQKGAGAGEVAQLDANLAHFASLIDPDSAWADLPGAGAAGGAGFGLFTLGAKQVSGADYILDLTGFYDELPAADLVVTGEGRFDSQSLLGKGPGEVIAQANSAGTDVWVVCGSSEIPADQAGVMGILSLAELANVEQALSDPLPLLTQAGELLAEQLATRQA